MSTANSTTSRSQLAGAAAGAVGLLLTFGFYAVLPYIPYDQAELNRYFNAHWVEHVSTGLFFVGISTLSLKALRLPQDRKVLQSDLLEELRPKPTSSAEDIAETILSQLKLTARGAEGSQLVKRIREACYYVKGRRSAADLEGHLAYLAETGANRLSDSYALIRTITWAIPILGFLGTVIGITMAIANVTPDQLESSLNQVTAGLAVAFDTTALALALSMGLVFSTFLVERSEQGVLDQVEDYSIRRLMGLFPTAETATVAPSPLTLAETEAAAQLLAKTEAFVGWQTDLWRQSMEQLRERWTGTLTRQQDALDEALQQGFTLALQSHAAQLQAARDEFLQTVRLTAENLGLQIQQAGKSFHDASIEQSQQVLRLHQDQAEQIHSVSATLTQAVTQWHDDTLRSQKVLQQSTQELHKQTETLLALSEQESQLLRLEDRLVENLQAVRAVETLEETLISLNAAVSLLSARNRGKAA